MPARNAPSAIDTPNSFAEPTAMPSATTSTVSVNSSRDRVAATRPSSQGMTPSADEDDERDQQRRSSTAARPSASGTLCRPAASAAEQRPAAAPAPATVNRSSTTSQPTAMWPVGVCRSLLSASTRISTTVLATEIARPKTSPADQLQPNADAARRSPAAVATRLCPTAPGTATRRTASSSLR